MTNKKSIVDPNLIRRLADLLTETGLNEIEIERDDTRIRVARTGHATAAAKPALSRPAQANPTAPAVQADEPARPSRHPGMVHSPMVGTVFRAPQPSGQPFVKVGDTVAAGDTLLIVEAMKTMNQIPAPRGGKIAEILIEDGQPVEYDEPLMIIE